MKMAVAALVIAAGSIGAFAFTKAEKEVKKAPVTYYVTAQPNATHYAVQLTEPNNSQCDLGDDIPCKIETTAPVSGGQILISDVNDTSKTSVMNRQPEFGI